MTTPINNAVTAQVRTVSQVRSQSVQPSSADATTQTQSATPKDRLELSGLGGMLELAKSDDVRMDKVADIRAQIEAGTYETDEKLMAAADKLLDELL